MDHGGLKGPKHQLLSQGGIVVLARTMSIECNLTESGTFYRKGGWWGSCQKHGEYRTVEENGPKAKNTAGHWVFLFHRVLLMYITHTANLYMQTRISFSFSFKKTRTRGVQRASRHSIILGSRVSTLQQTFPEDED